MKNWPFVVILVVFISVELLILTPEFFVPSQNFVAAVLPATLIDQTNLERQELGHSRLKESPLLTQAAELKARDLATRGYFSHAGPAGESPWVWLDKVGYDYLYAGENLAVNFSDSVKVHRAWMNSPRHRSNVLDDKFSEIGVGVAQGKFNGHDSLYVVQFFGTTEETLFQESARRIIGQKYLLSTVATLSGHFVNLNRQIFSSVLELSGYQSWTGEII